MDKSLNIEWGDAAQARNTKVARSLFIHSFDQSTENV